MIWVFKKHKGGLYGAVKISVRLLDGVIIAGIVALAAVMILAAK